MYEIKEKGAPSGEVFINYHIGHSFFLQPTWEVVSAKQEFFSSLSAVVEQFFPPKRDQREWALRDITARKLRTWTSRTTQVLPSHKGSSQGPFIDNEQASGRQKEWLFLAILLSTFTHGVTLSLGQGCSKTYYNVRTRPIIVCWRETMDICLAFTS